MNTFTVSTKISDQQLSKIIHLESGGKPSAKAATSSASGLGQFIEGTWLGVVKKHRPELFHSTSRSALLAMRFQPKIAIEMLARFTEDNAAHLGRGWSEGDLYLAHFAGVGAAKKLFTISALAPASAVFSAAAINANRSILAGKTCGQVRMWAEKKMAAAGGRNWVAVHYSGARPITPKKTAATALVTTAAAATTATAAGTQQGAAGWLIWAGVIVACVGVAALAWALWPRRGLIKLDDAMARDGE